MIKKVQNIIREYIFGLGVLISAFTLPIKAMAQDQGGNIDVLRDTFMSLIKMGATINDTYDNALKAIYGDCATCAEVVADHVSDCWSCFLVEKVFDAVDTVSTGVYAIIADPSRIVLTVLLGLWLLYHLGKHLMAFSPQEPADFWTKTGKVLFKAMFAGALLTMPISYVSNLLISPVIVGAVEFNQVIVKSYAGLDAQNKDFDRTKLQPPIFHNWFTKDQRNIVRLMMETTQDIADLETTIGLAFPPGSWIGIAHHTAAGMILKWLDEIDAYENLTTSPSFGDMTGCSLSLAEPDMDEGRMLNSQIYNALWCLTEMIHKEISFGMAMGSAIICQSWHAASYIFFNGPDIGMLAAGIMIWGTCLLILVAFVFKLLDAVLRLGILGSVLPFLIIAWVFPSSINYAKQGFKMLVHVMMNFIVLAIVIALAIIMVMNAFQLEDGDLRQMCMLNNVQGLRSAMDLSGATFLFAFACCFFAVKVTGVVDKTASEYSEVQFGSQAGDKVGAMAAYVTATALQGSATLMAMSVKKVNQPAGKEPPDKQKTSNASGSAAPHNKNPHSSGGGSSPSSAPTPTPTPGSPIPSPHSATSGSGNSSPTPKLSDAQDSAMTATVAMYNSEDNSSVLKSVELLRMRDSDFKRLYEIAEQKNILTSNYSSADEKANAQATLDKMDNQAEYSKLKKRYYDAHNTEYQDDITSRIYNAERARRLIPDVKDREACLRSWGILK